jgi:HPt (histidine-containing phosphotransfer) domain-containing protein
MTSSDSGPIEVVIDVEIREIIPYFLETRRKDLKSLETAFATGDLTRAREIGHNMKGAGGSYGFDEISRLGQVIEQAADKGDLMKASGALRELRDYLDRVVVSYEPGESEA